MDDWSVTVHRLDIPVQEFIDQDGSVEFTSPGVRSETFEAGPGSRTHAPAIDDFAKGDHGRTGSRLLRERTG